ncbi:MAG: CBS domain-containing protein [Zoogloeaceae bacterium]|nr:CBS domain-containing protein [Zoogloeaceae bacterium]
MKRDHYLPLAQQPLRGSKIGVADAAGPERVREDSPALEVMTDLRRVPAATVAGNTSLTDANHAMKLRGVRLLLVVDGQREVVGVITTADLLGERPVRVAQSRGGKVQDLEVGNVMTPLADMEAVFLSDVAKAEVGHVVATLRRSGRQHALVIERGADGRDVIRGIFSAAQIARQIGLPMEGTEIPRTFAEIEAAIAA